MNDDLGHKDKQETARKARLGIIVRSLSSAVAVLAVTACSQTPTPHHHSAIDPVWGVERAKKKVADGQPVPPGGGRLQVGKPYMVGGRMYFPREDSTYDKTGYASWYGGDDHGRETANGEVYDKDTLSAAHPTLPIPSYARVTNLDNGRSVLVRINDRGPYVGNRLVDVSERTAQLLGFHGQGLGHVRLQYVGPAPIEGSDQRMLVASLRGPGAQTSIAQDRMLIAQRDRSPSDGRMTGIALANLFDKSAPAPSEPQRPVMMASLTQHDLQRDEVREPAERREEPAPSPVRETAFVMTAPKPVAVSSRSTWNAPPPPPRPQIAIAAVQPIQHSQIQRETVQPEVTRAPLPLPPNTLGTLTYRAGQPNARPIAGTASSLAPLGASRYQPAAAHAAPGAIMRSPGSNRYEQPTRVTSSQGYMPETTSEPASAAIERLIAINVGPDAAHIDLGAYARPENAARVAELMRPYGEIHMTNIVSGLGEKLTRVELLPSAGMVPGDVISVAERYGIRSASLTF